MNTVSLRLKSKILVALTLMLTGVSSFFQTSSVNAANLQVTLDCLSPTNLTAAVGDTVQVTFMNCSGFNLFGGNGNGMFLNPTSTYQNGSTGWPAPSTGWSSGSRTWNLKWAADNTVIDFVVMGSANNGNVLIGPSSNLLFDSTKSPIFWWRMASVTPPQVSPAISPSTQSLNAIYGAAVTPTSSFTPAGMTTPITYLVSPALPAGLSLDSNTGVISGTIQQGTASVSTYTIRALDANLQVATSTVAFSVTSAPPSLTPSSQTLNGVVGTAIVPTATLTAAAFSGPPTYSVSPSLPSGLSLDSNTGVISGTPTTAASGSYTLTANSGSESATSTVTISITEATSTNNSESTSGTNTTNEAALTPSSVAPLSSLPSTGISVHWFLYIQMSLMMIIGGLVLRKWDKSVAD